MIKSPNLSFDTTAALLAQALSSGNLSRTARALQPLDVAETLEQLERLNTIDRAVAYRTLPKGRALEVFERFDAPVQADLLAGLQDAQVAEVFSALSPEDRVPLLDELPATVANRLVLGLSEEDRMLTTAVLGYPRGAVGRYMSPQFVTTSPDRTAAESLARVRSQLDDAESVYTIPVTDGFENAEAGVCGRDFYETDAPAALTLSKDALGIDVDEKSAGKWILIYVRK